MLIQVSGHLADLLGLPSEIDQALADSFVGQEVDKGTVHIQNNDDGTKLLRVGWFGSSGHASRAHWGSPNGGGLGRFGRD
jgi:hypothetical protein